MKKQLPFMIILTLLLAAGSCQNTANRAGNGQKKGQLSGSDVQNPQSLEGTDTSKLPKMTFRERTYDFGTATAGEKVRHSYVFTNTGQSKLIISNTSASCGCTVPTKPEEPIPPGATDSVVAVFNTKGKSGQQNKTIYIHANTIPKKTKLHLKGKVVKKES